MKYSSSGDLNLTTTNIYVTGIKENHVATGFFLYFEKRKTDTYLVTNRHVAQDAKNFTISLHSSIDESCYGHIFDVPDNVIYHPQEDVDLCIIKMNLQYVTKGVTPDTIKIKTLSENMILKKDDLREMNYCEDVIMFGSPDGLIDSKNNLMIAYKGITSTHPYLKFYDKPEFFLNIPSCPGSSGSAIYLCNEDTMKDFQSTKLIGIFNKSQYLKDTTYGKKYMVLGRAVPAYYLLDFKSLI